MDKIRQNKTYTTLGSSNHVEFDRSDNDFYATDPSAVRELLKMETFSDNVWEPACGMGHIAKELKSHGYNVKMTDLYSYGFDECETGVDFFKCKEIYEGDIVSNPPYNKSMEFVKHALNLVKDGNKVVMFLKIQFLESSKRYNNIFKDNPPKRIYVAVKRYVCKSDGDFTKDTASALCYCWFVWEKGFKGEPSIRWFNYDKEEDEEGLW